MRKTATGALAIAVLALASQTAQANPCSISVANFRNDDVIGQEYINLRFANSMGPVIRAINEMAHLNAFSVYRGSVQVYRDAYTFKGPGSADPRMLSPMVTVRLSKGVNAIKATLIASDRGGCDASYLLTLKHDPNVLDPSRNLGLPAAESCIGNPINIATGNKFQAETDYPGKLGRSLLFTRFYNSQSDGKWRHSYATALVAKDGYASIVLADGRSAHFTLVNKVWTAENLLSGALTQTSAGWSYTDPDASKFTFDGSGRLTDWQDRGEYGYSIVHRSAGMSVTDRYGNVLDIQLRADLQPARVTGEGLDLRYDYDAQNRLIKMTRTTGAVVASKSYEYTNAAYPQALTAVINEAGTRYASWQYDDQGRAVSSEHAGGVDKVSLAYRDDESVAVTNALGKQAIYRYQTLKGIKRLARIDGEPSPNCPASNSSYTYDSNGLRLSFTDQRGIVTRYKYNTRGLEIERTEAAGTADARTTRTVWHDTLNLPLSISTPAQTTRYTYSSDGQLLSQTLGGSQG